MNHLQNRMNNKMNNRMNRSDGSEKLVCFVTGISMGIFIGIVIAYLVM